MAGGRVMLEGPSVHGATVVYKERVGAAVQWQSIESALPGTEPEFVRSYRSNDAE